jgi:phospholipase A1
MRFSWLVLLVVAVAARAQAPELERCARIEEPQARLACFDRVVPAPPAAPAAPLAPVPEEEPSLLGDRWAIGISDRDSRFDLRAHKPSYLLLARYSDAPNQLPGSPTKPPLAEPLDVQATESKFQVSFKVKLADFGRFAERLPPAALWVGYTQQSQWQVYNPRVSRPFRETNYEPEAILAFYPDRNVLGWRWRLAGLGINHQSNGRAEPLSRSWNRVIALVGAERGDFGVIVRAWLRIKEDYTKDDNPDITRYLGYGDVVGVYRYQNHTLSVLGRYNPATAKGALQLAWNFPLQRRVRGYLQAFSGYGESLIDYNVRQNTIGLGISLADYL